MYVYMYVCVGRDCNLRNFIMKNTSKPVDHTIAAYLDGKIRDQMVKALFVCMYVCMYVMYVCNVCMYVCMYGKVSSCMYVWVYGCMLCMYVCMYVMYVCNVCVCMYYMYVLYVCTVCMYCMFVLYVHEIMYDHTKTRNALISMSVLLS